jgi:hypothetical protein
LGFQENTDVVLSGDHLMWDLTSADWYSSSGERKLLMVFTGQQKGIEKKTMWFDVAPTLLDVFGRFATNSFGRKCARKGNGTEPGDECGFGRTPVP